MQSKIAKSPVMLFLLTLILAVVFLGSCRKHIVDPTDGNCDCNKDSIPNDGLVAFYKLDNNAKDFSGNNYHGDIHGANPTTNRFGKPNEALKFDGLDDYIAVKDAAGTKLEPSKEITISAFILPLKSHGNNPWSRIVRKCANFDNGYVLSWDQDQNSALQSWLIYNAAPSSANTPHDNTFFPNVQLLGAWHHVAMTYSVFTKVSKLYVDGILVSKKENSKYNFQHSRDILFIGGSSGNMGTDGVWYRETFPGSIDDVRIYDRALKDNEILQLYHESGWKK